MLIAVASQALAHWSQIDVSQQVLVVLAQNETFAYFTNKEQVPRAEIVDKQLAWIYRYLFLADIQK